MDSQRKIFPIISIQIAIILSSFLILIVLENNRAVLGGTVNNSGKNRYFAASLMHEISEFNTSSDPSKIIANLQDYEVNLNELRTQINENTANPIIPSDTINRMSGILTEFNLLKLQLMQEVEKGSISEVEEKIFDNKLNHLVSESNIITQEISLALDNSTFQIILLEVVLVAVNIVAHIILVFVIIGIQKNEAGRKIELETTRKKAELLRKIDVEKDQFTAMITHELKTPLVPIQGYVDILLSGQMGELTSKQKDRLSIVKNNSEFLLSIISDLLDVQKIEMNKLPFNFEKIKLQKILKNLEDDFTLLMKEKGIEFVVPTNKERTIFTDQKRLLQAIKILIMNAIDFVPKENGKIEIKVEDSGTILNFQVIDNGIDIDEIAQKNIFKKFYQIDRTVTRKHGGSGLGLAICNGLLKGLGGKLEVKSREGEGSTFLQQFQ